MAERLAAAEAEIQRLRHTEQSLQNWAQAHGLTNEEATSMKARILGKKKEAKGRPRP